MKFSKYVFVLFVSAASLMQCKTKKQATVTPTPAKEQDKGNPALTLDINKGYAWPGSTDPFKVLSAEISDQDSLIVEVEYGGGCKEHQFKLITTGMLKKSMPPQCTVYLEHENNEDMCRALIRQKCAFYIGNLAPNGETIVIQIFDHEAGMSRLMLNPATK